MPIKPFFYNVCKISQAYSSAVLTLVALFTISSSVSLLSFDMNNSYVYLTPQQVKSSLKNHLTDETYIEGRNVLLGYEDKKNRLTL